MAWVENQVAGKGKKGVRTYSMMVEINNTAVPKGFRNLVVAYILTWFIPRPVYLAAGSLDITPQLVVGILLFFDILICKRVKWSGVDVFAFGILFTHFVCISMSSGIDRGVESTGRMTLELMTTYMIGKSIAQRPELMLSVLRVILGCLAFFAPFLLIESYYRFNIHCAIWPGFEYNPHYEVRLGLTRAYGWTSHCIMLGITYAAFAGPAVTLALEAVKGKLGKWIIVGLILSGVFFSLSTGAWLVAFISLSLMYIDRHWGKNKKQKWKFIGMCAIAGYVALWLMSDNHPVKALMYHVSFLSSGWFYRWQLWERVMSVMPEHWIFGYGENLPEEFTSNDNYWSIDNHYLVLLLQQGMFGVIGWLAFNYAVLKSNIKNSWIGREDLYARLLRSFGFTIIGYLFSGLTVCFFSTGITALFLAMGIASTSVGQVNNRLPNETKYRYTQL